MKGYQFLENDFFELCQTREIGHMPMLLYIYLRGLFCRFQKPIFTWQDKKTSQHLGISQSTLLRAREYLQTRGMIKFVSGKGSRHTEYTMLGTVLLPIIKKTIGYRHTKHTGYRQNDDTYNTSKERLKNKVGFEIFKGIPEEDRAFLRNKGLYD